MNWMLHPKQCRRLVKKKRREIWMLKSDYLHVVGAPVFSYDEPELEMRDQWIKFIEVEDGPTS